MIIRRFMTAGALAALIAGAAFAGQSAPAPQAAAAIRQKPLVATQALFDSYVASNKLPGIVAAFGYDNAPTMFVSAGKIDDGPTAAPAGPDSLWRVYSMTKPITATAAMILIEDGKIKLDEPVSDFIPAFKTMRVQLNPNTLETRPATRPITIRNLLTHTAGLGYSIITKGPLLDQYNKFGINPAEVNTQLEAKARLVRPASLEAFANKVAELPLIAEPGTKWSYSISLDVMGRVIEVASGMKFDAFVQKRIFDPLRMTSSYWTVPASETGRFATNYLFVGDNRIPFDPAATSVWLSPPSFPYGGAGLVMSARDYDRFLHALQEGGALDGARIMKPETAALMMSNLLPPGTDTSMLNRLGNLGALGFGAGGSVTLTDQPGGAGKGTYGWGGAAGTIAFVDRARHLRGTIMVNYFPSEKWPLRPQILAALATDIGAGPVAVSR